MIQTISCPACCERFFFSRRCVGGAGGGAGPAVTRATFGECPQRMSVVGGGTEVSCSHGPCTMVSAEVASVGVLAWMVVRKMLPLPCFFLR